MSIVDFESLKITTMTVIVKLNGAVDIGHAFPLLDITRLKLPTPVRQTKKFKIPYCGIKGAILSAKYQNNTRGIVKSKSKKSFLNSITIDVCTSKKNINAKLSSGIIHICGPDSEDLARETAQHVIDHLINLQKELDYIKDHPEERDVAIEWLKQNTTGDDYIIDSETQNKIDLNEGESINSVNLIVDTEGNIRINEKEVKFEGWSAGDSINNSKEIFRSDGTPYIVVLPNGDRQQAILDVNFFVVDKEDTWPFQDSDGNPVIILVTNNVVALPVKSISIPDQYPNNYPDNIDPRIVNFYIKYAPDFAYHHVFCQFLDSVKDINHVTTYDLAIDGVDMAMINYSYSLGMCIDRWELAQHMNGRNGFAARYINSTDHSVTITLPCESPASTNKKKPKKNTFTVHRSGIVTQSGPNIDSMRSAYYRFMISIQEIRNNIIQPNKPFSLKFRPIRTITPENRQIPVY